MAEASEGREPFQSFPTGTEFPYGTEVRDVRPDGPCSVWYFEGWLHDGRMIAARHREELGINELITVGLLHTKPCTRCRDHPQSIYRDWQGPHG
jgi:hypothetical protein